MRANMQSLFRSNATDVRGALQLSVQDEYNSVRRSMRFTSDFKP